MKGRSLVCSFFLRSRLLGYFLSPSRFPKRARLPTSRLKDVFNHADSSLSLSLSLPLRECMCLLYCVFCRSTNYLQLRLVGQETLGRATAISTLRPFHDYRDHSPKIVNCFFPLVPTIFVELFFLFCCCCCCFFFLGRGLGAARSGASSIRWRFLFSPPVLYAHVRCYDSKLTFPFEKRLHSYSKYCRTQTRQYQVDIKGISEK